MTKQSVNTINRKSRWIRLISFFLVLTLLLALCSWALYPRDNTRQSGITHPDAFGFSAISPGLIDIVAIGNSNIYSGFSPMELWGRYGYASYVSGEPRQQMVSAVSILKKYLTTQSPKVVILDADEVFTGNNHLNSVAQSAIEEHIPLIKYHNNWKTLRFSTLLHRPCRNYISPLMGQSVSRIVRGYTGGNYMKACSGTEKIPTAALISLNAFTSLCREHNIPLLLITIPCATSWSTARHDAIAQYAKENGLTYLDFNVMDKETGFDWHSDTGDGGTHLNISGSRKITAYLGAYLKKNYSSLQDRRSDAAWALWGQYYARYCKDYAVQTANGNRESAYEPCKNSNHRG